MADDVMRYKLKRYASGCELVGAADGDLVGHRDYAALKAELERMRASFNEAAKQWQADTHELREMCDERIATARADALREAREKLEQVECLPLRFDVVEGASYGIPRAVDLDKALAAIGGGE